MKNLFNKKMEQKMKKYFLFILFFCCLFSKLFAESLIITSPTGGQTFYIPAGQSTMNIQVSWTYDGDGDPSFKLYADGGPYNNVTSPYTVQNVGPGSKIWSVEGTKSGGAYISTSVDFTVVLTTISITADNNFTAPNGTHGKIGLDGNTNLDAPYSFSRNNKQVLLCRQ